MRIKFRRANKKKAAFDMTPFLDMVFLLNIFFMLTATFAPSATMDVDLPRASSAAIVQEKQDIVVQVDQNDRLMYGGNEVTPMQLIDMFRKKIALDKECEVVVEADRLSSHGTVVMVMDAARTAGLKKFSIAAIRGEVEGNASL
jgi:biopolymer transport protein ExbD